MVSKEFFQALDMLEAERGVKKEFFIENLEAALTSAFKRMHGEAMDAKVKLDPAKNTIRIWSYKTVVESDEDNEEAIFEELKYMLYEIEAKYNAKKKKPLPAPTDNDLDEELCHQQYSTETEDCQA